MSIPKIPPSAAKLFHKKRGRRQVVVDPELQEDIDTPAAPGKIESTPPAAPPAAPADVLSESPPADSRKKVMRRRG